MINAAEMSPEQKLEFIERQICAIQNSGFEYMTCPYCGGSNTQVDSKVCCEMFGRAAHAILDRMHVLDAIDFVCEVQDRVN